MKNNTDVKSPIIVYPDPIIDIEMLSGAMFLYFDRPIALTLPPVVVTEKSYDLLAVIDERKPKWSKIFYDLLNSWVIQQKCCDEVFKILEPLKGNRLITVWTVYPADRIALEKSEELIKSSGLSTDVLKQMINPINAPGELVGHIMSEAFLECNKDINKLFDYCTTIFDKEPLDNLLIKSYILRLNFLNELPSNTSIAITNYQIWSQLLNGNVSNLKHQEFQDSTGIDKDVISWEIFKTIISPRLDPMNEEKVDYIVQLLKTHREQIDRLKLKCFSLADKLKQIKVLDDLPKHVVDLVKSNVEKDLIELFDLDKKALKDFLALVFSDEKAWLGIASFIAGIISGSSVITTGGAIAALSLIGSKSVQAANRRMETINHNDYGLAYIIAKKYKT